MVAAPTERQRLVGRRKCDATAGPFANLGGSTTVNALSRWDRGRRDGWDPARTGGRFGNLSAIHASKERRKRAAIGRGETPRISN